MTIVFYFTLAATAAGAAGLPFAWTTPGPELLAILVATGARRRGRADAADPGLPDRAGGPGGALRLTPPCCGPACSAT